MMSEAAEEKKLPTWVNVLIYAGCFLFFVLLFTEDDDSDESFDVGGAQRSVSEASGDGELLDLLLSGEFECTVRNPNGTYSKDRWRFYDNNTFKLKTDDITASGNYVLKDGNITAGAKTMTSKYGTTSSQYGFRFQMKGYSNNSFSADLWNLKRVKREVTCVLD